MLHVQNSHQTRCTPMSPHLAAKHKLNKMFDLKSPFRGCQSRLDAIAAISYPPVALPSAARPGRIAGQTPDYASPARSSAHVPHAAVESTRTPPPPSSHPNPP